jgi:hypothetical protein
VTDDDTTLIEWISSCEPTNDSAVSELCNPIYRALLSALENHFAVCPTVPFRIFHQWFETGPSGFPLKEIARAYPSVYSHPTNP